LRGGDEVTQRTEIAFEGPAGFFHGLRIEAYAGELDEMFPISAREIHAMRPVLLDDFPAARQVVHRQTQLGREHVHGPEREHSERDVVAGDAVHDFVDRSIAACRHNPFVAFRHGVPREVFGLARVRGGAENGSARQFLDLGARTLGSGAARRWIKNDDGVFQSGKTGFRLFFKLGQRNLPA